jgi:hypothetical protein
MMKKILAVIMMMVACFTGCVAGPKPPIELPFAVHQAGATVSTELWIVDKYKYPFVLRFEYKEKDKADQERVRKLVGSGGKNKWTGKIIDPGIPIPLLEKDVLALGEDAHGINYFERDIDRNQIKIPPGLYRVTVQSLKDIPELANTKVFFVIRNPRGK